MTHLLDIEVFGNTYFVGVKDYHTKEYLTFEISPYLDQRKELYGYYSTYSGYLVTFNGEHYDNMVNNYFLKNYNVLKNLPVEEFLTRMKKMSDIAIEGEYESIKELKWIKNKFISIDLFLYWAKSLRQSKKISLKSLAVQLDWDEIQELPFHHTTVLTKEEIEIIKRYNLRNDLGILEKLFIRMQPDIELRYYIQKEYGLSCWSMDAPKITSEILLKDYCIKTHQDPNIIRKSRYNEFNGLIGDIISDVRFEFINPQLDSIYQKLLKSGKDFDLEEAFNEEDTSLLLSLGIGGIHSLVKNKIYNSTEDEVIISSDIASLYPTAILEYKCFRQQEVNEKYSDVKKDRLIAKKNKDKLKDTFLKLVLNSTSGIIDSEYSWTYYPEGALRMRVLGQLIMLKSLDVAVNEGYKVLALNTDSIDVLINKSQQDAYEGVIDKLGQEYKVVFEHDIIKSTYYAHINGYIQISQDNKVKRKGLFKHSSDIPLGDAINEQIIPKALELYFTKGVSIDESITNPNKYGFTIYDYCKSNKISKDYSVYHNNIKVQNMNRYYFSKEGPFLFKKKHNKNTLEHVNVGEGVMLFNKYEDKPWEEYKINYKHYTKKARDIINTIQVDQRQLSLF